MAYKELSVLQHHIRASHGLGERCRVSTRIGIDDIGIDICISSEILMLKLRLTGFVTYTSL